MMHYGSVRYCATEYSQLYVLFFCNIVARVKEISAKLIFPNRLGATW